MSEKPRLTKYANPGNPIVIAYIKNIPIPNTLVDQGATINIMTITTMEGLQLENMNATPILLELADRSKVKPISVLRDVIVSLASWEFPVYFMVIQPNLMEGHPLILGRPWLATTDAYISCRNRDIIIYNGLNTKKINSHPPAQPVMYNPLWLEDPYKNQEADQFFINIYQTRGFQDQAEEHTLDQFLSSMYQKNIDYYANSKPFSRYEHVFSKEFQENSGLIFFVIPPVYTIDKSLESCIIPLEISRGKVLYINPRLDLEQ